MPLFRLAMLYGLFAAVAIAVNLGTQRLVYVAAPGPAPEQPGLVYWFALFAGTGTGLVAKYLLDKRWIFHDRSAGVAAHGKRFSLYTLMGVVTTVIFWGTQTAFLLIWRSEAMIYLGGAIGLTIGYVVKYRLDKRFVFDPAPVRGI